MLITVKTLAGGELVVNSEHLVCFGRRREAPYEDEGVWLAHGERVAVEPGTCQRIRRALEGRGDGDDGYPAATEVSAWVTGAMRDDSPAGQALSNLSDALEKEVDEWATKEDVSPVDPSHAVTSLGVDETGNAVFRNSWASTNPSTTNLPKGDVR